MNDGMNKALNKIADIIDDMSIDIISEDVTCRDFLRGYLTALRETNEITQNDYMCILKFYDRLIHSKRFIAE